MTWIVARYVKRWRAHCHAQRKAWLGEPDDDSRSELWLNRAEGASAMLDWLGRKND